jgi:hypothetical protein
MSFFNFLNLIEGYSSEFTLETSTDECSFEADNTAKCNRNSNNNGKSNNSNSNLFVK